MRRALALSLSCSSIIVGLVLAPGGSAGPGTVQARLFPVSLVTANSAGKPADADVIGPLAWSRGGKALLFSSSATNLVPQVDSMSSPPVRHIYAVLLADRRVRLVDASPQDAPSANPDRLEWGGAFEPSWDPSGARVALASRASNLAAATAGLGISFFDDARLIYVKNLTSGAVDLLTTTADGSITREYDQDPTWSPDGRWIAFSSVVPLMPAGLVLKDLQTGAVVPVGGDGRSAWNATSTLLAFCGATDLRVFDLRSRRTSRIGTAGIHGQSCDGPVWSADVRYVAFTVYRGYRGGPVVGTRIDDLVTRESRLLSGVDLFAWAPHLDRYVFSPDGRELLIGNTVGTRTSRVPLPPSLELVDSSSGPSLAWSPDGARLGFLGRAAHARGHTEWYVVTLPTKLRG